MVVRLFKLRYLFFSFVYSKCDTREKVSKTVLCNESDLSFLSRTGLSQKVFFKLLFFLVFSIDTLPLNVLLVLLFCFIQWLSVLHALCITSCQLLTYRDLSWKLLTVLEVYKKFKVWYLFLLKAILLTVCTLGLSVLHQREPQWQWPVLFFATDWFSN